jgi:hypothetical protein
VFIFSCSLLVLASSTCVWGLAARAIHPTAQLAQAADAAPNQLAQIVPCSAKYFSVALSVLEFPGEFSVEGLGISGYNSRALLFVRGLSI